MPVQKNVAGNVAGNIAGNISGAANAAILATFLIDGVASVHPSYNTIANAVSYAADDFEMVGSGSVGTKTFTRSTGDPAADAGTGSWWCVAEHSDGTLSYNTVLSAVGDVFTLSHPLPQAAVKLHQAHRKVNGQHFSPKGAEALAEHVYGMTRQEAYFEKSQYSLWGDDEFATDPWSRLSTNKVPAPWNGAANNSIDYNDNRNPWTATDIIHSDGAECLEIETNAQNEGFTVDIATNGKECFLRTSVGFRNDGSTGLVEVLFDGVNQTLPDSGVFGASVYSIKLAVPASVATVTIRAKRTNTGTDIRGLRIGGIFLTDLSDVPEPTNALISPSSRVGLFGDSYFDSADANGLPFHNKFASLHSGFLVNHATGGSQISSWLPSLQGWLDADNLDIAIMHSGINERNAAVTRAAYWADVNSFIATCKASGVTPVILTAGATASQAQTVDLFRQSAFDDVPYADRWPQQVGDWHDEATTSEIANTTTARINLYKKVGGKTITRLNDSATLTAAGSAPTDIWS
jgi:hypothetical protein